MGHSGYHAAYEYVTKDNFHCVKSSHHPENVIAPKTLKAMKKMQEGLKEVKKAQKVNSVQFADIILKTNIHTMLEVFAYANEEKPKKSLRDPHTLSWSFSNCSVKNHECVRASG